MALPESVALFDLYRQVAPAELFRLLLRQIGWKARAGIYSARLVMWMMMIQRLQPRGTLASSVAQLVEGRFDPLLSRCKRVREKHIGLATGGYCQARQHLPKLLVSRTMDELIERLRNRLLESGGALPQRTYLLDGSSLQLEHESELEKAYPREQPAWQIALAGGADRGVARLGDRAGGAALLGTTQRSEGG